MYDYLKGEVIRKSATSLVLEVGGVGFTLTIPISTFERLPALGQTARVLTEFVVREDAHILFGFATEEERQFFRLLLSVSGIGPKTSLTILSGMTVPDLKRAIVEGKVENLTSIPGVGKKTAERLIVELREKIVTQGQKLDFVTASSSMDPRVIEDSVEALVALGYRKQNAKTAIEKTIQSQKGSSLSLEELIRGSLKNI